jgi:hypothetical protein
MFTRRDVLILLIVASAGLLFFAGLGRYCREEQDYSLIEDGLYMGADVERPPPGTGAVLNLCEDPDPYQRRVHVWEPIRDSAPAPDIDWLRRMVDFIDAQRRAGVTTFVHCRNGVSRSGMVVTAYLMFKNNWTRDEALAFVRSKRPIVRPNRAFMERLLEWEQVLKERRRRRAVIGVRGAGPRASCSPPPLAPEIHFFREIPLDPHVA